jgi:hypothetical protein
MVSRPQGIRYGMAAAGYGFGAIATTFPISYALGDIGFDQTLTTFGLGLLVCGVLISFGIRPPNGGEAPETSPAGLVGHRNFSSREILKTPIFRTMCFMMTLMASGGLMVISQFALFVRDLGAANAAGFGLGPAAPDAIVGLQSRTAEDNAGGTQTFSVRRLAGSAFRGFESRLDNGGIALPLQEGTLMEYPGVANSFGQTVTHFLFCS